MTVSIPFWAAAAVAWWIIGLVWSWFFDGQKTGGGGWFMAMFLILPVCVIGYLCTIIAWLAWFKR